MAPDVWEKKLRKMNGGGKIWHQLLKNQLPRLRNTTTTLYLRLPDSEVIAVFELSDQLPPLPAIAPVPSFPAIGPLASVEIPVLPVKLEWHRYVYIKTKMPDKLNLLTGETSGETDIVYTAAAPPTGEKFPVSGYEYVGMNYLLVSNSDQPTLIDCSFAFPGTDIPARDIALRCPFIIISDRTLYSLFHYSRNNLWSICLVWIDIRMGVHDI